MSRPLVTLNDRELEAALRDLSGALAAPEPRIDLARAARLRIEAVGRRRGWADRIRVAWPARTFRGARPGRIAKLPVRRSIAVAIGALLLLAGLAAALDYGLPGLRIIFVGPTPSPSPSSVALSPTPTLGPTATPGIIETLRLGREVDLASIDAEARFHVRLPDLPGLGSPLGAVVELAPDVTQASVAYPPTTAHPAVIGEPVALLVTEVPAKLDEAFLAKFVGPGTTVQPVTVGGKIGYWLSGTPHQIAYLDAEGRVVPDSIRLAGNVLAWNDGEITYRIEGAPDLGTALAIAASLH